MKKIYYLSTLLAIGSLLTACSDKDDDALRTRLNGEDEAYISLNLYTPVTDATGTRAETYTDDDGLPEEYAVNNGIIVFFENSSDNQLTSTIVSAYKLPGLSEESVPKTDEVTTQWRATLNITGVKFTKTHMYALVILNNQDYFTVDDSHQLLIGGTPFEGTFTELMRTQVAEDKIGNGDKFVIGQKNVGSMGLLMTNAPLSKTTGSASPTGVQYLTKIEESNIQAKEADAISNSINIYVERAAAKIQVSGNVTKLVNGQIDETSDITVSEISWMPDNISKTFNVVREVNQADLNIVKTGGNNYRFTGTKAVLGSTLYRTTWAIDQTGYTSELGANGLKTEGNKIPTYTMLGNGTVAYIPENTMDYNQMYQRNTTRIILKATLGNGSTDYFASNTISSKDIYTKTKMVEKLTTYAKGLATYSAPSGGTQTFTLTENATTGKATFSVATTGSEDLTALNDALADIDINYYKNGASYYKLQIKHYHPGTDLSEEVAMPVTTNGSLYNNVYARTNDEQQKKDYLGLYGVVRNTWYVINVGTINNIGTPTIPEVPGGTPDDEVNSYISAKISVMSWAKRSQSAIL